MTLLFGSAHLGQEALDGRVGSDQVQEGRQQAAEAGGRHADQVGAVVAAADVVGVTHHVVQDHLRGAGLRTLQPEPGRRASL